MGGKVWHQSRGKAGPPSLLQEQQGLIEHGLSWFFEFSALQVYSAAVLWLGSLRFELFSLLQPLDETFSEARPGPPKAQPPSQQH